MADRGTEETPPASSSTMTGAAAPHSVDQDRVASQGGTSTAPASTSGPADRPGAVPPVGSGLPTPPGRGASAVGTGPAAGRPAAQRPRGTRKARLRLVHLDPWSVMKTAFLLSIALGIVTVVAVALVWSVLSAAGVWDSINKTVTDVLGGESAQNFDVEDYVGTSRVLGFTMLVAALDVLLITAISTLGAFLYNLAAALLGGVELTLAEDER